MEKGTGRSRKTWNYGDRTKTQGICKGKPKKGIQPEAVKRNSRTSPFSKSLSPLLRNEGE